MEILNNRVADIYFKPKKIEKESKIYEKVGVILYKHYVPTYGSKLFEKKLLNSANKVKFRDSDLLKTQEKFTRIFESIHVIGAIVMAHTTALQVGIDNHNGALMTAGLNTFVNLYPIMLQRYNRMRINHAQELLARREERIPKPKDHKEYPSYAKIVR